MVCTKNLPCRPVSGFAKNLPCRPVSGLPMGTQPPGPSATPLYPSSVRLSSFPTRTGGGTDRTDGRTMDRVTTYVLLLPSRRLP
eukprot:scaffold82070_cov67-Attheya_sp.AAC.1